MLEITDEMVLQIHRYNEAVRDEFYHNIIRREIAITDDYEAASCWIAELFGKKPSEVLKELNHESELSKGSA